jgi:hypothetical protein
VCSHKSSSTLIWPDHLMLFACTSLLLELFFVISHGRAHNNPHNGSSGATHNLHVGFNRDSTSKPSRKWQPPRVTSTTSLQHEHLVPLDAIIQCNTLSLSQSIGCDLNQTYESRGPKSSTTLGQHIPRCSTPSKVGHPFYLYRGGPN